MDSTPVEPVEPVVTYHRYTAEGETTEYYIIKKVVNADGTENFFKIKSDSEFNIGLPEGETIISEVDKSVFALAQDLPVSGGRRRRSSKKSSKKRKTKKSKKTKKSRKARKH